MPDLIEIFKADPAGWTSVLLGVALVICSAIFWRRVWRVLKWFGRWIRRFWRYARSLRVVTADRLKDTSTPIRPVRWDVNRPKAGKTGEFALANWGEGSIATNVRLDVHGTDVALRSGALWDSIPGGEFRVFSLATTYMSFFMGVTFEVTWTDARGEVQVERLTKREG